MARVFSVLGATQLPSACSSTERCRMASSTWETRRRRPRPPRAPRPTLGLGLLFAPPRRGPGRAFGSQDAREDDRHAQERQATDLR